MSTLSVHRLLSFSGTINSKNESFTGFYIIVHYMYRLYSWQL